MANRKHYGHWRLRLERIWMLAKTEFSQRYYGSGLGLVWALINPLLRITVYYFAFSYLIFRQRNPEFVLYLFLGITLWQYFAENTNKGLRVLKTKKYLLQNIETNKPDLFIATALSTAFSFFLTLSAYLICSMFFDVTYSWRVMAIVPIFLSLFLIVSGTSMVLSCLYLYMKDLQHFWDIVLLAGMWTLPVIWDYKILLTDYQFMIYSIPLTGLLINFRYAFLYDQPIDWGLMAFDFGYALIIFGFGIIALKFFSHKAVESQ